MRQITALYRLLVQRQLGVGRLVLATGLSALAIAIGTLIARSGSGDRVEETVAFLSVFGLGLTIPVLSLALACSSLGHLVEDETLVYLWIRPNPRWMLGGAAWLASVTVVVPVGVIPLTVAAAIGSGNDIATTGAIAASMTLAAVAYTGIFTLMGLLIRRALIWGLVYVFIWEFFVARAGAGTARFSINTYPASVLSELSGFVLSDLTDGFWPPTDHSLTTGIVVPLAVALVSVALTTWRLNHANVA